MNISLQTYLNFGHLFNVHKPMMFALNSTRSIIHGLYKAQMNGAAKVE